MGWRIQFVLYFSFLQASSSSDFWKSNKNCHYHYHMLYIFLSFLRPKVLLSLPSVLYFLGISTNWGTLPNSVFCVLLFRVLLFHLIMRFRKSVLWIWCYGFTIPGLVFRVLPLRIWCSGFSVPDLVFRHSVFRRSVFRCSWFYYMPSKLSKLPLWKITWKIASWYRNLVILNMD